jgi:signal transduction histidine kinase
MIAQLKENRPHPHPRRQRCRDRCNNSPGSLDDKRNQVLVAQFSHELRNSLGTIRSAMHVMTTGNATNPAQERARVLIDRQLGQLTRMVDDLLDVSRMRNGRMQLRRVRIDLCIVLAQAMQAVEYTMQQRQHRMVVSFPDSPVWLNGDAARLEQVFVNLLLNAAKYTDAGGVVSLSLEHEAEQAIVVIRDTGIGIAAEVLPKVFDLYVQANPSARKGGLGLGLPLVRSLVEGHGGGVSAASDGAGHGSEFTVRLPAFPRS